MSACKGCGAEFRKGTLAFLLTPEGLKGSRVCAACVKRGVLLVPVLVPPVKVEKVSRPPQVDGVLRALRTYTRMANTRASASGGHEGAFAAGRAEGLESAIETIKRELGL